MLIFMKRHKGDFFFSFVLRSIVCALSLSLIFAPSAAHAQSINFLNLPVPGTLVQPTPAFAPVLLKGLTIHPDDPLKFDFIIDSGSGLLAEDEIKEESEKLLKYFLASMTVPKDDLWVNLSPYEQDRIIPEELGKTELGRDMLAQDYILKQLTASLMYPEEELGQRFWDKIYKKAKEEYGVSEIPVNTFNKVWIVPERATVYEHEQTVYIVDTYLKVMLDSDYQARLSANKQEDTEISSQVVREIIIPEIEKEVNQGQHFAPLRQIYHSLILAKWYKETMKASVGATGRSPLLLQIYADQNKIDGVDTNDPTIKDQIYNRYIEAYKRGVFNYIKEDYDRLTDEVIPRKYFSGGLGLDANIEIGHSSSPIAEPENLQYRARVAVAAQSSSPAAEFNALKQRTDERWTEVKNGTEISQKDANKSLSKFNEQKQVQPYRGVTTVAWVEQKSDAYNKLVKLQEKIDNDLKRAKLDDRVAFVKPESFHMTVYDLKSKGGKDSGTEEDKKFNSEQLEVEKKAVQSLRSIGKVGSISTKIDGVGLMMPWSPVLVARVYPKTVGDLERLYTIRDTLRKSTGVELPPFIGHITLGYIIKPITNEDYTEFVKILAKYQQEIAELEIWQIQIRRFTTMNDYDPPVFTYQVREASSSSPDSSEGASSPVMMHSIAEAEKYIKAGKYADAISVLRDAGDIIGNQAEIDKKSGIQPALSEVYKNIQELIRGSELAIKFLTGGFNNVDIENLSLYEKTALIRVLPLGDFAIPEKMLFYSGAPGSGKGAIMDLSFGKKAQYGDIVIQLLLYHTRNPRTGEINGKKYHFGNLLVGEQGNRLVMREGEGKIITTYVNRQLQGVAIEEFTEEIDVLPGIASERLLPGDIVIEEDGQPIAQRVVEKEEGAKVKTKVRRQIKGLKEALAQEKVTVLEGGYGWFRELINLHPDIFTIFLSPFTEDQLELIGKNQSVINQQYNDNNFKKFLAFSLLNQMHKEWGEKKKGQPDLSKPSDLGELEDKVNAWWVKNGEKEILDEKELELLGRHKTDSLAIIKKNVELIESKEFIKQINHGFRKVRVERTIVPEEEPLVRALAYDAQMKISKDVKRGDTSFDLAIPTPEKEISGEFDKPQDMFNRVVEGVIQALVRDEYVKGREGAIVVNEHIYDTSKIDAQIKKVSEEFATKYFNHLIKGINKRILSRLNTYNRLLAGFFSYDSAKLDGHLVNLQNAYKRILNEDISLIGLLGEEFFRVTDKDGNYTGEITTRALAHDEKTKQWHRTAGVFIIDDKTGNVLFQLRSKSKRSAPGAWDVSAGGHMGLDEPEAGIKKEIEEEVFNNQIKIDPKRLERIMPEGDFIKNEEGAENATFFVYHYSEEKDGEFTIQKSELSDLQWKDGKEFSDLLIDYEKFRVLPDEAKRVIDEIKRMKEGEVLSAKDQAISDKYDLANAGNFAVGFYFFDHDNEPQKLVKSLIGNPKKSDAGGDGITTSSAGQSSSPVTDFSLTVFDSKRIRPIDVAYYALAQNKPGSFILNWNAGKNALQKQAGVKNVFSDLIVDSFKILKSVVRRNPELNAYFKDNVINHEFRHIEGVVSDDLPSDMGRLFSDETIQQLIFSRIFVNKISRVSKTDVTTAKAALAVRLFHELARKRVNNYHDMYKAEYQLIKMDYLLYLLLLGDGLNVSEIYHESQLNMFEAFSKARGNVINDLDELEDDVERIERVAEETFQEDTRKEGVGINKETSALRHERAQKEIFELADPDYFAQNISKRLAKVEELKGTVLGDYLAVLGQRAIAQGRESFLFLVKDDRVSVIPFNQFKNPRVPGKTEADRWARQYAALHFGRRFSDGVGFTEAENGRGMQQRWHIHDTTQEFTTSLSDHTVVRWARKIKIDELAIFNRWLEGKSNKKKMFDKGDELVVVLNGKDETVIKIKVDGDKEEIIVVEGERRARFGEMIAMPKSTFHTLKNSSSTAPSADFTIKDPVTQLVKTFSPSDEVQLNTLQVNVPEIINKEWGSLRRHIYQSAYNTKLDIDAQGRMSYDRDDKDNPIPKMHAPQFMQLKIVEVEPGQTTDLLPFSPLYDDEQMQVVRIFPWPKEIPEDDPNSPEKNWELDRDHVQLKATVEVFDKKGKKIRGLPAVNVNGGDMVLLNNSAPGKRKIAQYRVTNNSENDHSLIFFVVERSSKVKELLSFFNDDSVQLNNQIEAWKREFKEGLNQEVSTSQILAMEFFRVTDENGEYTGGIIPRDLAHQNGAWHRAIFIFIVNKDGKILRQQRALDRDRYPGAYDIMTGGHHGLIEKSLDAAVKELGEEIFNSKITIDPARFIRVGNDAEVKLQVVNEEQGETISVDNEAVTVFLYQINEQEDQIKEAQPGEVAEDGFYYVDLDEALADAVSNPEDYAPGTKAIANNPEFLEKIKDAIAKAGESKGSSPITANQVEQVKDIRQIVDWLSEQETLPEDYDLLWLMGTKFPRPAIEVAKLWKEKKGKKPRILITGGVGRETETINFSKENLGLSSDAITELDNIFDELTTEEIMEKFNIRRGDDMRKHEKNLTAEEYLRDWIRFYKNRLPLDVLAQVVDFDPETKQYKRGNVEITESEAKASDALYIEDVVISRLKDRATRYETVVPEGMAYYAILLSEGVRESDILVDAQSTNSVENIINGETIIGGMDIKRIILIQEPYIQKRGKASFDKEMGANKYEVISYAAYQYDELDSLEKLTQDQFDLFRNRATSEIKKLMEYPGMHKIVPVDIEPTVMHAYERLVLAGHSSSPATSDNPAKPGEKRYAELISKIIKKSPAETKEFLYMLLIMLDSSNAILRLAGLSQLNKIVKDGDVEKTLLNEAKLLLKDINPNVDDPSGQIFNKEILILKQIAESGTTSESFKVLFDRFSRSVFHSHKANIAGLLATMGKRLDDKEAYESALTYLGNHAKIENKNFWLKDQSIEVLQNLGMDDYLTAVIGTSDIEEFSLQELKNWVNYRKVIEYIKIDNYGDESIRTMDLGNHLRIAGVYGLVKYALKYRNEIETINEIKDILLNVMKQESGYRLSIPNKQAVEGLVILVQNGILNSDKIASDMIKVLNEYYQPKSIVWALGELGYKEGIDKIFTGFEKARNDPSWIGHSHSVDLAVAVVKMSDPESSEFQQGMEFLINSINRISGESFYASHALSKLSVSNRYKIFELLKSTVNKKTSKGFTALEILDDGEPGFPHSDVARTVQFFETKLGGGTKRVLWDDIAAHIEFMKALLNQGIIGYESELNEIITKELDGGRSSLPVSVEIARRKIKDKLDSEYHSIISSEDIKVVRQIIEEGEDFTVLVREFEKGYRYTLQETDPHYERLISEGAAEIYWYDPTSAGSLVDVLKNVAYIKITRISKTKPDNPSSSPVTTDEEDERGRELQFGENATGDVEKAADSQKVTEDVWNTRILPAESMIGGRASYGPGIDPDQSSSPITARAREIVRDELPEMVTQLNAMVGKSVEEGKALGLQGNKFFDLGFEHGKANRLGWTLESLNEILNDTSVLKQVKMDGRNFRKKFDDVIFSGMGGSGLSVQVVKSTFGKDSQTEIHSLRTTDPSAIRKLVDHLRNKHDGDLKRALERTKIVVSSKSGTTAETESHLEYFVELYDSQGVDPKGHFMVTTDPGSPMDWEQPLRNEAIEEIEDANKRQKAQDRQQLLERLKPDVRYIQFNNGTDIGGRFTSPTTRIFLLPLAVVAPDQMDEILKLAQEMNSQPLESDQFALLGAYMYAAAKESSKDKVTFLVPDEIRDIPIWSEQLFEESLGKHGKGVTIFFDEDITLENLKPRDDNDRVFVTVNLGNKITGQDFVTKLKTEGYPVFDVNIPHINAVGGLMLGLQRVVSIIGYLWDINFVDQDGVEGYKNKTREVQDKLKKGSVVKIPGTWNIGRVAYNDLISVYYQPIINAGLQRQRQSKALEDGNYSSIAGKLPIEVQKAIDNGEDTKEAYVGRIIDDLKAGIILRDDIKKEVQRLGATMDDAAAVYAAVFNIAYRKGSMETAETHSYGEMTDDLRGILQKARGYYTQAFNIPTKLGEGPDLNHSYMQNIAEGKDMIVSTFVMPLDTVQPQPVPYNVNLLRAPTIGTVQSLIEIGRKGILITIDKSIENLSPDELRSIEGFFEKVNGYFSSSPARNSQDDESRDSSSPINVKRGISSEEDLGGIDLNDINVDRQGVGVDIQFDPVELQEIMDGNFTGFAPVIINFVPLPSVLPLLGLEPKRDEEFEVSSLN